MAALALAYLAGLVTLLNPCVLPLLPIVVGAALQESRFGPLALGAGLALTFAAFGTLVAGFGFAIGLDGGLVRQVGAVLLIACGAVLLFPRLQSALSTALSPVAGAAGTLASRLSGRGLGGQFVLGLVLGAVWSPCVGPTLGAAVAAAAQGQDIAQAGLTMSVFGLGAATALAAFAYALKAALIDRRRLTGVARWAKPLLGTMLIVVGALVLTGADKSLEAGLVEVMPAWLLGVTTRW